MAFPWVNPFFNYSSNNNFQGYVDYNRTYHCSNEKKGTFQVPIVLNMRKRNTQQTSPNNDRNDPGVIEAHYHEMPEGFNRANQKLVE